MQHHVEPRVLALTVKRQRPKLRSSDESSCLAVSCSQLPPPSNVVLPLICIFTDFYHSQPSISSSQGPWSVVSTMAPAGYAPLPNPRSQPDADRELNEAFESDGEEYDEQHHTESAPFLRSQSSPTDERSATFATTPGTYDFERDYDHPPPGSPPGPSTFAFPNDYGNSNGLTGSTPAPPTFSRPSFFRRAMGALLPQYYSRVPTEPSNTRTMGGGTDNDGVFANVMAKPSRPAHIVGENGEVHLVPEETQADAPPVSSLPNLEHFRRLMMASVE